MIKKKNILFFGANKNSPAYKFYCQSFSKLKDYNIEYELDEKKIFDRYYKFIFLHTGYNKKFDLTKFKGTSKFILVEPRTAHFNSINDFDFLIVNSFETQLFFSKFYKPSFIYPPIYQYDISNIKNLNDSKKINLVYHGNGKHIRLFEKKLNYVLKNLKNEKEIDLHLIYDLEKKKIKSLIETKNINIFHYQHSHAVISEVLSKADIGLVPQLIPENRSFLSYFDFIKKVKYFTELKSEYILRFKENSNLGRHLVFSQFKVPIITDPTISSIFFLTENYKKFLAYNKFDWLNSINFLINNKKLADKYGEFLQNKWKENFSHEVLNEKLISKIEDL